ncbi:TetR/AcrR family transcriptional regulator [Streptomyces spectabilis]|uniref:AcrR family transcriptional regulator n=1 Tax=Streptomyces spectabilis TaxID=68270 RepID=A0A5P2XHA8_STRST|nr:TetR/AcrR family transcriptional regulator [Streptomyces spectabilis]MBB5102589.1 AcrR family transcriptional regulator [Streptomyces spectabilis]MCI3907628.1 TetR/AcrR family transcriptional regulator [Streptomyces spectabilis]QEV64313.1 TetR/AcrR family transcriptional regulator [Streptomyces spectabilis]GGV30967.1 TetR family transcriptional regulator [Streptomyces spectabilis]
MAYHHGNLRSELLARAEEVVATDGADALSLRSLARDLGVSHAAPSRHFADRLALLDALATQGFGRLEAALEAAVSSDGTFEERLRGASLAYVGFATGHPALLELMYARKHRDPAPELRAASDACARTLLGLLADSGGAISDPERFGVILLACLQGIATFVAGDSLPPEHRPDELVADAVQRLLRGSRDR